MRRLVALALAPAEGMLWPRWIFLRALGLVFFSAFYALAFQIHGLIGERGILPAADYLHELAVALPGVRHLWYAPTLLWAGASDRALTAVVAVGIVASLLLTANLLPRAATAVCTICFMSCVAALQDFSAYQSDGMLLEAGFIAIFFAPPGLRPGLGAGRPPSRLSLFLLQWEWFRIYFESGVVKLASGDPHWRNLTAMDQYYENGPLPAWPGWYVQQLMPHWYHAATALLTLVVELGVVWLLFLPRRFRIACFAVVTALQLGIIATANYAFLNYLVLVLGVLLLDDRAVAWVRARLPWIGARARQRQLRNTDDADRADDADTALQEPLTNDDSIRENPRHPRHPRSLSRSIGRAIEAIALAWVFVATLAPLFGALGLTPFLLPARVLEPMRIANEYGLFANMTDARYEIEFQGSRDGTEWRTYRFRYKPQDPMERPGIYAPYQPRFDWNLWFASLGPWRGSPWVVIAQERLVEGSPSVLALFRDNPFPDAPPTQVRTVLWQYWFTDPATKRRTGAWWRRQLLGPFAGTVVRRTDGQIVLEAAP